MTEVTGIDSDILFRNASIGILVADERGQIVMTNPFLQQQFGYGSKELSGTSIEKLIPARFAKKHQESFRHAVAQLKNNPKGVSMTIYGIKNDGLEFPIEVSLSSYQKKLENFVIAFINDISLREKAEVALKELNEQLEHIVTSRTSSLTSTVKQLAELITETELKDIELNRINVFLRNIWLNAQVILFVTNADGIIKMFNPAAERELGYCAKELVDQHTPLVLHEPAELKKIRNSISKSVTQKLDVDFNTMKIRADLGLTNDIEIEYLRKDGSSFPASLTITPIRHSMNDEIEGYLGVAMNISKRKNAEEELLVRIKREKEVSDIKSQFVSMASHELRTPLSTILSSVYLLSKYAGTGDQQKHDRHVDRIISMVHLLTEIINDFLSIEKIEENKITVHNSTFDVSTYIQSIILDLESLKKKDQIISFCHTGTSLVNIDSGMLKRVIVNLLSNAIKFSKEGGLIEISTNANEVEFQLTIKDFGLGISIADQQYLFERFFRGENAIHAQGTGLGLHIVAKYVELMGGVISFTSGPNLGTAFNITFRKS